jgi:hypothetical protein
MNHVHRLIGLRFVPLVLLVYACTSRSADPELVPYGRKIVFHIDSPLHFADFDLTFLGERREPSIAYSRGFLIYDFRATHGSEVVTVSWSAGTGDIGPSDFRTAGRNFELELKHSDRLGALTSDELVVNALPTI